MAKEIKQKELDVLNGSSLPVVPVNKPTQETITITKDQLSAFVQDEVAKALGAKIEKPKRVTEHTAYIRFFEDQPVVGLANVRERLLDGKKVGFVDLNLLDGSVRNVEYLNFLNESERETVSIIKQNAKQHVKNYGTVRAINPDPYNQKTWNGGMIDLEVTSYTYQADVEVISDGKRKGEKYSVSTEALNI